MGYSFQSLLSEAKGMKAGTELSNGYTALLKMIDLPTMPHNTTPMLGSLSILRGSSLLTSVSCAVR